MKPSFRVYLEVEILVRELDGRLLLAGHLIEKGFSVVIGARSEIRDLASQDWGAVIILKGLNSNNADFYERCRERKHIIFVQDVEGSVYLEDIEAELRSSYPEDVIQHTHGIFLSGPSLQEAIHERLNYIDTAKLVVSGDPRFDLLKEKYRPYYVNSPEKIRTEQKTYVLINTNFGVANPRMGAAKLWQYVISNPNFSKEKRRKHLLRMSLIDKVMPAFISAVEKLAAEHLNINWLLRPHPSEDLSIYNTVFDSYSNVVVSNKGSVVDSIIGAKFIIHFDCTTAIEGVWAGKRAISFLPFAEASLMSWLPVLLSAQTKNFDELSNMVRNTLLDRKNLPEPDNAALKTADGFLRGVTNAAAETIAEVIESLDLQKNASSSLKKEVPHNNFIMKARRLFDDARNRSSDYKFHYIELNNIVARCVALRELDNLRSPINGRQISGRLVEIWGEAN
jgi:surface carbohydrate biosynthesis protein